MYTAKLHIEKKKKLHSLLLGKRLYNVIKEH